MDLFTVLRNIYLKIQKNINVERITNTEIDDAFGGAAGTGTDAQDYVVEHYISSTEGYTKWASGKCEVWKRIYKNISSTTLWVAPIYYGGIVDNSITYTMNGFDGFIEPPNAQITLRSQSGNIFGLTGHHYANGADPTTNYGTYYVYSVGSQSNVPCTIQLYAIGRWK